VSEFVIERGVPLPPARYGRKPGSFMETVRSLNVGDSFVVTGKHQDVVASTCRVVRGRMNDGRNYATRKVDGGVRVWRIK
jgi:hypothetical protein